MYMGKSHHRTPMQSMNEPLRKARWLKLIYVLELQKETEAWMGLWVAGEIYEVFVCLSVCMYAGSICR
jgi:hypothetical protein